MLEEKNKTIVESAQIGIWHKILDCSFLREWVKFGVLGKDIKFWLPPMARTHNKVFGGVGLDG